MKLIFHGFRCLLNFFKSTFLKFLSGSNSLDTDQAQHYLGPKLFVYRLSADHSSE